VGRGKRSAEMRTLRSGRETGIRFQLCWDGNGRDFFPERDAHLLHFFQRIQVIGRDVAGLVLELEDQAVVDGVPVVGGPCPQVRSPDCAFHRDEPVIFALRLEDDLVRRQRERGNAAPRTRGADGEIADLGGIEDLTIESGATK